VQSAKKNFVTPDPLVLHDPAPQYVAFFGDKNIE